MDMNIMYVTEEEKQRVLKARMEAERKAKRKRLTEYERVHRIAGTVLLIMALICLRIGGEMIVGTIMCGIFSIIGFIAKEEAREEWYV